MRRLVGISSRNKRAAMAGIAIAICLTSIHLAAAARTASLRRQQEQLENSAISTRPSVPSPTALSSAIQPVPQNPNTEPAATQKLPITDSSAKTPTAPAVKTTAAAKRRIVISIADRKLALVEDGKVLKTYPIAVGTRHTPSPEGEFVIVNRAKDPVYRHRDKEIQPGKDNPLGTRWMGLSQKGYGIHGTNVQSSVGKPASHGCFRMRKQDVEELYTLVQVGDPVIVRRERDAAIVQLFPAPENAQTMTIAKSEANAETQVAAAAVSAGETTEQ